MARKKIQKIGVVDANEIELTLKPGQRLDVSFTAHRDTVTVEATSVDGGTALDADGDSDAVFIHREDEDECEGHSIRSRE